MSNSTHSFSSYQQEKEPEIFKSGDTVTKQLNDLWYVWGIGLLMVFYISVGCFAIICSAEVFRAPTRAWIENWGIVNLVLFAMGAATYWYSNYNTGTAELIAKNASQGSVSTDGHATNGFNRRWILQAICVLWSVVICIVCLGMFATKADDLKPYESDNTIFYMGVVTFILSLFPIAQAMILLYMATDKPAANSSLSWSKRILLFYTVAVVSTVVSAIVSGYFVQRDTAFKTWSPQYEFGDGGRWFLVSSSNVSITYGGTTAKTLTWKATEPISSQAIKRLKLQTGNVYDYEDAYGIDWEVFLKGKISDNSDDYAAAVAAIKSRQNEFQLVFGFKVIQDGLIKDAPKELTIEWNKQGLPANHVLLYATEPKWNSLSGSYSDKLVLFNLRDDNIPWLYFYQDVAFDQNNNVSFKLDTLSFTAKY